MQIEIKNVKHSEFASHETHCFEATVYVDGKRAFIASNEGQGGPNNYHALKAGANNKMWERISEINDVLKQEQVDIDGTGKYFTPNSLDLVVGDLLNTYLTLRHVKNKLRRRIMAVKQDGTVMEYKADPKRCSQAAIKQLEQRDNVTVLNGLSDEQLKTHLKTFLEQ